MRDGEVVNADVLGVGVGLNVLEQAENGLSRFYRPATGRDFELLSLSCATNIVAVAKEGNASSVSKHILEVLTSLEKVFATDGSGRLEGWLEVDAKISTLSGDACKE